MDWYIATTKPHAEKLAVADLAMEGLMTFLPVARVDVFDKRKRKLTIRKFPLFYGYVFAAVSGVADFGALRASTFITGILGNDGKPFRIANAEIDALLAAQNNGAFDRKLPLKNKTFKVGDQVQSQKGIITGFHGVVVSVEGKKAVVKFKELIGMLSEMKIDVDDLQKVA